MRRTGRYFLALPFSIAALLSAPPPQELRISAENAYNPVPSPDGTKIAAVRTGWFRLGGSGGSGRSNLLSELIVLDRTGRLLTANPIADSFVSEWNRDGLVTFRDWSFALITESGEVRQKGRTCSQEKISSSPFECTERVAYLQDLSGFIWVDRKFGDSALVTSRGELSPHHRDGLLDEWLAPSPDGRYVAIGPGRFARATHKPTYTFDLREKKWSDLGAGIIHPDAGWDWMQPSWSPWFPDSSRLVFFSAERLVSVSPDGKHKQILTRTANPLVLRLHRQTEVQWHMLRSRPVRPRESG